MQTLAEGSNGCDSQVEASSFAFGMPGSTWAACSWGSSSSVLGALPRFLCCWWSRSCSLFWETCGGLGAVVVVLATSDTVVNSATADTMIQHRPDLSVFLLHYV